MEKLQITKEDAIKAYENASKKGKKLLADLFGEKTFQKNVMERIITLQDVLDELGEKDSDVIEYRKLLAANLSDHIIANQEVVLITKALNEGWLPNWSDSNEYKYVPWFKMNDSSSASGFSYHDFVYWRTSSLIGSRLCFKKSELAKYAGSQFVDLYKKLMVIN